MDLRHNLFYVIGNTVEFPAKDTVANGIVALFVDIDILGDCPPPAPVDAQRIHNSHVVFLGPDYSIVPAAQCERRDGTCAFFIV